LNPIEQVFAKLNHLLGKEAARTVEAVCSAVGELLDPFTPKVCANYFKNAGYDPTQDHPALALKLLSKNQTSAAAPAADISYITVMASDCGGRYWDRTSVPYDVNVVLYR